jgi:hypothetical protein
MRIATRSIAACASSLLMALATMATVTFAQTPTQSLKDRLVGHWQLVTVTINNTSPFGAKPQGSMFLDAGGHYSVVVITSGNERNIAYFGTYTVNDADSSMTMHVDSSSRPNTIGRDEKRFISFNGNELIVSIQKTPGPLGGVNLTWQQAN